MKAAYAGVTQWLRFNAVMVWQEIRICNEGCIAPLVRPFVAADRPDARYPDSVLHILEEVASAIWLLERERAALNDRLHELFAPRAAAPVSDDLLSALKPAEDPVASLQLALDSIGARLALLANHPVDVDAHSRLVLRKHATELKDLVVPALARAKEAIPADAIAPFVPAVAGNGSVMTKAALLASYQDYLPGGPRPHPDDFLALSLLKTA